MRESLDRISQVKIYTQLNLIAVYNRMRIKHENEWKIVFRTRYDHFEYQMLFFDLVNTSASFQVYINRALAERLDLNVIMYLNDILIYFRNSVTHVEDVKWILKQFRKHSLYINLNKCKWHTRKVNFLSYIVSSKKVTMQKNKIQAIRDWLTSKTINDIQQFVDLINFYWRFIQNFSRIVASLTLMFRDFDEIFRKNKFKKRKRNRSRSAQRFVKFLTFEVMKVFEILKLCFVEMSLFYHFDFVCRLKIEIDASDHAIDDMLIQLVNNEWHFIAYYSIKMKFAQCNYEIHDQKLLTIVEIFKHWRHYLKSVCHKILVLIDHHNLKKFIIITKLSSRQMR